MSTTTDSDTKAAIKFVAFAAFLIYVVVAALGGCDDKGTPDPELTVLNTVWSTMEPGDQQAMCAYWRNYPSTAWSEFASGAGSITRADFDGFMTYVC